MWKKVQDYIKEYDMLRPGDRVIVALSGGADSVCLLSVLHQIQNVWNAAEPEIDGKNGLELKAVHVHHGLRGEEADRDVRFVQNLCGKWNVPLVIVHRRVAEYAAEHGMSTEEAGRVLRYEAFEQEAEKWRRETAKTAFPRIRIAVAHHQDDNAETILHHLLRGSGLRGLSGIRPVQGSRIRPLLCVNREEILKELKRQGLSWCEDSTNQESDYTRNRIRNQIIPLMRDCVNERAVENIVHAGEIFSQADGYLRAQAEAVWSEAGKGLTDVETRQQSSVGIDLQIFCEQDPIIQTYLVRHMLDLVTPGWKDITSRHFGQIAALAKKQVGSRCDLPCGMMAVREYEKLVLKRVSGERTGKYKPVAMPLCLPFPDDPPQTSESFTLRVFSIKKGLEIPKNWYTKWFDYDKIKSTLFVRSRKQGDYFTLQGGGTKTVARYMIDEKIPREKRDQIPLLAEGNHILWMIGGRISEYYKITDTTKTILQVEFNGGKEYGREYPCITD